MKKFLAVAMATSLVFGSMGVTAFGSVFSDINAAPWSGAKKYIDEAQSLGLMNGYTENGKKYSKPKNNVTLCESVQMIYSIMKVHTKQDVSSQEVTKWTPVMSAYNIPTWAYNATAYALENKIIENSDLTKLKDGTQYATREEVGLMFGKALGTIYTVNNSATLSYGDKSKISSDAVPYLALLNSKNIMVGDTNNNFNPKAKINRAEMAVLSVITYNNLDGSATTTPTAPASGTVTGTVINSMIMANGDIFLSVKANSGEGVNVFGKSSSVKVTYDKETVSLKDIGTGDNVTITYNKENLSAVVINKSVNGIITNKTFTLKDLTSSKITVKDGSKEEVYRLDDDVKVTIADKKSTVSNLIDEMEDYEYNVTLTFDKSNYVTKIEAMSSKDNPLTGDLTYMNNSKLTIEVGSKDYDYPLSDDDVKVKFDGKTVLFSRLMSDYKKNNYKVTLKLDSKGYVTNIDIDFMEDETHGTLEFLNTRRLELSAAGETIGYYLDDDVDVEIDGKKSTLAKLKDQYEDNPYRVSLTVDRDDVVTEISATTKNSAVSKGTLKEVTSSKIKITVDGKNYEYDLDDPTVKIDKKTVSFSTFRSSYKDYEYEVELGFNSKGDVTEITGKNKDATEGILKNIEPKRDTIEIRAGGVNYTYDIDDDVTVKLDGSSSTVSKLDSAFEDAYSHDEEIEVKLTLNSKDDVTKIEADWVEDSDDTEKGTLRDIGYFDITIRKDSKTKTYDFKSGNVTMTLDGKSADKGDFDDARHDLDSNEVITVTLYLNSDDKVTKVVAKIEDEDEDKPTKGNLTSVSTSSGRLKIEDSSEDEYTWYAKDSVKIYYDDLGSHYDESDYDNDLSGLKKFLGKCKDRDDDCYVKFEVNSSDKVTKITATDK
ncbi:S-layer homology domain-containing protein [Anaerotignum sp.]|uniref:S-layer homology domain-containing protein n=1 Tax=Anaerotignum sp. TaxID=2039241 RepID=UPI0027153C4B|nr:S-layer homology domain-containing protein [Anaerotignum sp.]